MIMYLSPLRITKYEEDIETWKVGILFISLFPQILRRNRIVKQGSVLTESDGMTWDGILVPQTTEALRKLIITSFSL